MTSTPSTGPVVSTDTTVLVRSLGLGGTGGGPVSRQISTTITCSAPAAGIDSRAATKPPKMPPTHAPIDAPTSTDSSTRSGDMRTVLDMMIGLSAWFSIWV